jgi:peptide/nickel transport system permease protein
MVSFILRRLVTILGVLIAASYLFYILAANAGDPLEDLRASSQRNREQLIEARTAELDLNVPPPVRYFYWAGGVAKCVVGKCDFGVDWKSGQPVTSMLPHAMGSTIKLVSLSLLLAILIGISIGVISALRQYSGFDYGVTLAAFFMYSLPSFWIAVLLKQWGAIGFNDFLEHPHFPVLALVLIGCVMGLVGGSAAGGAWGRRFAVGGLVGLGTAILLFALDKSDWFLNPQLGPIVIAGLGAGIAVLVTFLATGLSNKRALYSTLTVAALGTIAWFPMQQAFRFSAGAAVLGTGLGFVALGAVVGRLYGGPDWRISLRLSALTGVLVYLLIFLDFAMGWWQRYTDTGAINGRPIATVGSVTPQLAGSGYWVGTVDTYTHMVLPVTALVLISLASYARYARASLLEVMNLDYIRTARAKGLPERAVIMRHAFRNALIPLATIIPLDLAGLFGGAVITETVFGWNGMGRLFIDALHHVSVNVLMAYFLVTGLLLLIGNIVADILYAVLDPRIRVDA